MIKAKGRELLNERDSFFLLFKTPRERTVICSIDYFEIDWVLECVWEWRFGTSLGGMHWVVTFLTNESRLCSKLASLQLPRRGTAVV